MLDRAVRFAFWAFSVAINAPGIFAELLTALVGLAVATGSTFLVASFLCHVAALPMVLAWIWAAVTACLVVANIIRSIFLGQGG